MATREQVAELEAAVRAEVNAHREWDNVAFGTPEHREAVARFNAAIARLARARAACIGEQEGA